MNERRPDGDGDIREELDFHIEMRVLENLASGMSPEEARAEAERKLGRRASIERQVDALARRRRKRQRRGEWMSAILDDGRIALRGLARSPGLALIAVLTLSIGIGVNTAVFSAVNGILLRPLPYDEPEGLTFVWRTDGERNVTHLSAREFVEYGRALRSFASLAAYGELAANLTEDGEPERVRAARVSGEAFATLGVNPVLGRTISAGDAQPGGEAVVVLGHALWQRRFAGAPDIVGRALQVDGRAHTVVGVMPAGFRLPFDYRDRNGSELWLPLAIDRADPGPWGARGLVVYGRLRDGSSAAAATQELQSIGRQWIADGHFHGDQSERLRRQAAPLPAVLFAEMRPALLVLLCAVLFVLLICCANVANLLLARLESRRHDHATRIALGASHARLARALLLESAWLSACAATLGFALAHVVLRLVVTLLPAGAADAREIVLDARALAFTAALALGTAALTGVVPAIRSAKAPLSALTGSARRAAGHTVRPAFRKALVAAQIALSIVLVVGAALLARSFDALLRIDPGFDARGVVALDLVLPVADYPSPADVVAFYDQAVTALRETTGVRDAGAVRLLPLTGSMGTMSLTVEGRPFSMHDAPQADWQVITPGYLETLGIPLVEGRSFSAVDAADTPPVAVVSRALAERFWPGERAIGKRFHVGIDDQPWLTVVGVVETVRHNALTEPQRVEMYIPLAQFLAQAGFVPRAMTLLVSGDGAMSDLASAARQTIRAIDADLPIGEVRTLEAVLDDARAQPRFLAALGSAFAVLSLALAALGLHALMAWATARRTSEMGVRMALGASAQTVLTLVLREGLGLALIGIAVGLPAALAVSQLLRGQLYGVSPLDPLVLIAVPLVITIVAALACSLPALRAARTSPLAALRTE